MSFLNWFFLKKFLFSTGVIGLSVTPIVLINKHGLFPKSHSLKKVFENITGEYAKNFGPKDLLKEVFMANDSKEIIEDVFVKDIAYNFFASGASNFQREFMKEFEKEEEGIFNKSSEKNSSQQKVFDSYGGTRESMKRRIISDSAYKFLKKEMLNFEKENFLMNRNYSNGNIYLLNKNYFFSKEELDSKDNWEKIGFFPIVDFTNKKDLENFLKEKFKIINWAYKRWYEEVKPFYVWMSLWKHKENVESKEMESMYKRDELKGVNLSKATYEFPYFSTTNGSSLSSTEKFKNFFSKIVNSSESEIFIPRGYTDDSATSIFVEGNNMYEKLYIKFAAAANYKYSKVLSSASNAEESSGKSVVKKEKTEDVSKYKQPFELFLIDDSTASTAKIGDILQDSNLKKNVADAVEINDTKWIFIRNIAGIHAIAVDSAVDSAVEEKEKVFGHFNYRTLQVIKKNELKIDKTVDVSPDSFLNSFKGFFEKNFSRLILQYLFEQSDKKIFGIGVHKDISSFENVYKKWLEFEEYKNIYKQKIKLRESLLSEYAKPEWVRKSDKKFEKSEPKYGLTGSLPYSISKGGDNKDLFKDLENLYDHRFFGNNGTSESKDLKKFIDEQKESSIFENINSYVDGLNTSRVISPNLESDRFFTNNFLVNSIVDGLLDKPEILDRLLFKWYLKTGYAGKFLSFVKDSQEKFIEVDKDLEITIPNGYNESSFNDGKFSDFEIISNGEKEGVKKVYGFLKKMLETYYYPSVFLDKTKSNPWDLVKYDGSAIDKSKDDNSKLKTVFEVISKSAFDEYFYLNIDGTKDKYYKFLNAFIYLTTDNFKNFRNLMSSRIGYFDEAWWINYSNGDDKTKTYVSNPYSNPYLNPDFDTDATQEEVKDWNRFLKKNFFNDYGGFYLNHSNISFVGLNDFESSQLIAKNLYKFGSDADKMASFVEKHIFSESDLNRVIEAVKEAVKAKGDDTNWLSNLDLKYVYVKDTDEKKDYRSLTFQERKNLLLAYLKKVSVDITSQTIDKSKYKDVFLSDPDNNYNLTPDKHTKGTTDKLNGVFEKKEVDIKEEGKSIMKASQISHFDFSSDDNFKNFIKNSESVKKGGFWFWIISLSLKSDIQDLAFKDLQNSSIKIKPYDSKWRKNLNSNYIE